MKSKIKLMVVTLLANVATVSSVLACTVCKKNQPEILQGITHGAGPDSNWDYVIVSVMVAVVVGTFLLSIRYLINPRETKASHIKNSILESSL